MELLIFLISFLVSWLLTQAAIKLAFRTNFLDYPVAHKIHSQPTPLLGGVAVFLGFLTAFTVGHFVFSLPFNEISFGILISSLLVLVLGLVDDKKGILPGTKLLAQIFIALIVVLLLGIPDFLPRTTLAFLVLIFWIVGMMNALNFLDNMDGLSGGVTFIACLGFASLFFFNHNKVGLLISLSLLGSLAGFLKFNLFPAKIFLGDTGSLLNGLILSMLTLLFAQTNPSFLALVSPLIILSYPIFDVSFVTLTRIKEGRRFYIGGKDHSSHKLVGLGWNPQRVVWWIYIVCFFLSILGVLSFFLLDTPVKILMAALVGLFLAIFGVHLHRNFVSLKEKIVLILSDLFVLNIVFSLFVILKDHFFFSSPVLNLAYQEPLVLGIWLSWFWLIIFGVAGMYELYFDNRLTEVWKVVGKTVLGGWILFLLFSFKTSSIPWKFWLLVSEYCLLLLALLIFSRTVILLFERELFAIGKIVRKAVILGTGKNAVSLLNRIKFLPKIGYNVIGVISEKENSEAINGSKINLLGNLESLEVILRKTQAKQVLVAVEPGWEGSLNEVLEKISGLEVDVKLRSNLKELARGHRVGRIYDNVFLRLYPSQMRAWEWGAKRIVDIGVSIILLIVISPILLVKWMKALFLQKSQFISSVECAGRRGKIIEVLQYNNHKEKLNSQDFSTSSLNKLENQFSFERLPGLINVLKGELSLVGPKLFTLEEIEKTINKDQLTARLLIVKPGLWGYSNLASRRFNSNNGIDTEIIKNLEYLENMSFTGDILLLFKALYKTFYHRSSQS